MKEMVIYEKFYKGSQGSRNAHAFAEGVPGASFPQADPELSVRELCEEAGINRSTFYAHYKDVYDLREQIETEMLSDFQEALAPLISQKKDRITPTDITAGIFRCLRENSDICAATLGKYGDRDFLTHLIDLGRDSCMKGYSEYFPSASLREIELFYTFVSAGCIALLQGWIDRG